MVDPNMFQLIKDGENSYLVNSELLLSEQPCPPVCSNKEEILLY